jgi:sugar fermentation stimulation protein A
VIEIAGSVTYVLILHLPAGRRIRVGRLGLYAFRPGIYFYVGSGGRSPLKRIARHIRKRKRKFWHIDFLSVHSRVIGAFAFGASVSLECTLARALSMRFTPVPGFGSSDCGCGTHLFFAGAQGKEV